MREDTNLHPTLRLPTVRFLTTKQAAEYLGIGVTLLKEIGPEPVRFGRRCVYDVVDLDACVEEYKARERAIKETKLWPKKQNADSISEKTRPTGGLTSSYQTEVEYAKALGIEI